MSTKNGFLTFMVVFILSMLLVISTYAKVNARSGDREVEMVHAATIQSEGGVLHEDGVVNGGPGFIMVSALDFQPYTVNEVRGIKYPGLLYNAGPTILEGGYAAGLTLPHGTHITRVTLYYVDKDAVQEIFLEFYQVAVGGRVKNIASFETDGSYAGFRYLYQEILDVTVNNQVNSYYLSLRIPPSDPLKSTENILQVSNVRIDYEYSGYLPTVTK